MKGHALLHTCSLSPDICSPLYDISTVSSALVCALHTLLQLFSSGASLPSHRSILRLLPGYCRKPLSFESLLRLSLWRSDSLHPTSLPLSFTLKASLLTRPGMVALFPYHLAFSVTAFISSSLLNTFLSINVWGQGDARKRNCPIC